MMEPVAFEVTVTLDEYVEAYRRTLWTRLLWSWFWVAFLFGVAGLNVFLLHQRGEPWIVSAPWVVVMGLGLWMAARARGTLPRILKPIWQSVPSLQAPSRIVVSEEGVQEDSVHFRCENRWSRYTHWAETKRLLLLYEGKAANIYPKRCIASEAETIRLRGFFQRHVGSDERSPSRGFEVVAADSSNPG